MAVGRVYVWLDIMLTAVAPDDVLVTLIRHGRTQSNAARRFMGTTDEPLDAAGRAQVTALREEGIFASVDACVSSPLRRTMETARLLGLVAVEDAALRELDQGLLEGLTPREAIGRYPRFFQQWSEDPTQAPVPGGERLDRCRDRALEAITRHAGRMTGGEHLVVISHLLVISSIRCTLADASLANWTSYRVDNAGVVRLAYSRSRRQLREVSSV